MKKLIAVLMFLTMITALMPMASAAPTVDEQKQSVRKAVSDTLEMLYKAQPSAKAAVEGSAGYAVFNNIGTKLFITGGGKGKGLAVNNRDQSETFMRMVELQIGIGFGVKEFSVIFVFDTEDVLNTFVNQGWEFGGQATLAASDGVSGGSMAGAASVSEGVWMYQLTKKGLAAEITVKGTRYYKDGDLK